MSKRPRPPTPRYVLICLAAGLRTDNRTNTESLLSGVGTLCGRVILIERQRDPGGSEADTSVRPATRLVPGRSSLPTFSAAQLPPTDPTFLSPYTAHVRLNPSLFVRWLPKSAKSPPTMATCPPSYIAGRCSSRCSARCSGYALSGTDPPRRPWRSRSPRALPSRPPGRAPRPHLHRIPSRDH
jgi:hypothetical protein